MDDNKKIFSISMVKNEMDVIESFVRYNCNIFDGMIILDNGSTDDTIQILNQLKNEGLPIFVLQDEDRNFDKILKMNQLLHKAVNEFNADIIIPLDADEFIVSNHKGNPKKFLKKLESPNYYVAKWKIYVPDFSKNEDKKFIPSKITLVRDDSLEDRLDLYKVILPKELVINYDVKLTRGSHTITYDPKYENILKRVVNPDLQIAHFPIRSKEQTISKVSVGWLNAISSTEKRPGDSYHWKKIFSQIKELERIEDEDVVAIASEFSHKNEESIIKLEEDPVDLSYCKNITLKYTDKKVNPMSNLLEACEWLSLSYLNTKKENNSLEEKFRKYEIKSMNCEHLLQQTSYKLEETENELIFSTNRYRSLSQRLISRFPSIFVFLKLTRTGIKNTFINWRGYHAIKNNNLLKVGYYLSKNPDVKLTGQDPIIHYIYYGSNEGRKPNPEFDGKNYLESHKDVKKSNINPLVHYSLYGMKEKRIK